MEQVFLIAKTSFVNRWTGSVNKKQRFLCAANVAAEFVKLGIAEYEDLEPKKAQKPTEAVEGGQDQLSASLPAAQALMKSKLGKRKVAKVGVTSQ
jgi:hypothetical protein